MITFQTVYNEANGCSEHSLDLDEDCATAITIIGGGQCGCSPWNLEYDTCGSYCDTESFAIGILPSGRFAVVYESSDSSGHG